MSYNGSPFSLKAEKVISYKPRQATPLQPSPLDAFLFSESVDTFANMSSTSVNAKSTDTGVMGSWTDGRTQLWKCFPKRPSTLAFRLGRAEFIRAAFFDYRR